MNKNKMGFHCYEVEGKLIDIIHICKKNDLHCFNVKVINHKVMISFRLYDRNRVKVLLPNAILLYTSGLSGMLFRNLRYKERVFSYLLVCLIWCSLSMMVFQINIYGESDNMDTEMVQSLSQYKYGFKDSRQMKEDLLNQYHHKISWLEVYEKGSIINIRYALKKKIEPSLKGNSSLIAKKDGMIAYFKCDAGYKLKKVKDVVKAGEIIVSNKMPNSFNQEVETDVNGKVYAYTWQNVDVEMEENKLPDAINYYSMILEARDQIDIDLKNDEKVVKENVLHFSVIQGKIKLRILYTLLEDITS